MIMAMKEMRYSRDGLVRSARAASIRSMAEAVDMNIMANESAMIRRKIASGRSVKRQNPTTPPPATPDANNGQA